MKENAIFVTLLCLVLCILPSLSMFYMTMHRPVSNTYFIDDTSAYVYASLFMFMGLAPISLMWWDVWKEKGK